MPRTNKEEDRAYKREYARTHRAEMYAYQREWRKRNIESYRASYRKWPSAHPERRRAAMLKHTRGITLEQYDEILKKQDGVCAICKLPPLENKRLVVDHDHACCPGDTKNCGLCVRGLVHNECNSLLGYAKERPEVLEFAAEYLRNYKSKPKE